MVAFESKPPAFLKGEYQPRDNTERLGLAGVCVGKKLNHAAAHLYADALAADPKAAGDLKSFHRYNAAGHALLAAAGHGEDRFRSGSWLAVSCRLVLTRMEMACCLVMRPSRVPLQRAGHAAAPWQVRGNDSHGNGMAPGDCRPAIRQLWSRGSMRSYVGSRECRWRHRGC